MFSGEGTVAILDKNQACATPAYLLRLQIGLIGNNINEDLKSKRDKFEAVIFQASGLYLKKKPA